MYDSRHQQSTPSDTGVITASKSASGTEGTDSSRGELLQRLAEIVQQRDAYRTKAKKMERLYNEAIDEVRHLRKVCEDLQQSLPCESMQRPTERLLRPVRPEGGYLFRGDDVPTEEAVHPLRGLAIRISNE